MNATKRSVARAGLVVCSVLAVALAGCETQVVHERTRRVYVPAPPPPPPAVVVVAPPEQPPVVVIQSANDFYEPLGAYGRWVVVGAYGRCWIPARVEAGWRPYSNGYWQRTDAGWYWASEEPWGWATYHYGRWDFHADYGWIWVPHTQWAPAWVSWREGGGYVGWAPLRQSVTIGVSARGADYEPAFASRAFVFVEHRQMLDPVRPKTVIVNNTTIINKTVNINQVTVVNKIVINEGPRPEVIERASGRKVQSVPAREFRHREETNVAARERNLPTVPERKVQPPARPDRQPAPTQAVLPRNAHVVEKPAETVAQPPAPPARPIPARPELSKPARDEKKIEAGKKVTTTPPPVEARPKPAVRPEARPETKRPVKVETAPSSAARNQTAPPSEKPADKRLISPKEKSRTAEQTGSKTKKQEEKGPKKKQGEDQAPQTPAVDPPRQPR